MIAMSAPEKGNERYGCKRLKVQKKTGKEKGRRRGTSSGKPSHIA
jgi:hypothetical protein